MTYPADYPDPKLQGKTYNYAVEVLGIKEKKLPELNDEFAKDVSDAQTPRRIAHEDARRIWKPRATHRQKDQTREKLLAQIVKAHDFPVPEALVEQQMDSRLERTVRSLAAQGVDPRAVNVDWVALRSRQNDRAIDDVKAELLLDRIATAENIEVSDEEVDKEIAALARTQWRIGNSGSRELDKAGSAR